MAEFQLILTIKSDPKKNENLKKGPPVEARRLSMDEGCPAPPQMYVPDENATSEPTPQRTLTSAAANWAPVIAIASFILKIMSRVLSWAGWW